MSKVRAKLKLITVTDAERNTEDSRLYVLNRTKDPVGNINITAVGDDGQKGTFVLPSTFIPFDMSNYISKKAMLAAAQFRRLVAGGLIVLVDSKEAEDFIASSDRATREQRRLLSVFGAESVESGDQYVEIDDSERQTVKVENTIAADPFIMAIIDRENTEDAGDLLEELDSRSHTLKRADVEFLMAHTKQATIKTWAADMLQEMDD